MNRLLVAPGWLVDHFRSTITNWAQGKQPNRNMGAEADEAYLRGEFSKHPKWWWHFSVCVTGGIVL
ncbi:hypothetical protein DPMN_108481 [Dreissena polymorpha]|uniref:Uncharacterized protein n=1 Tax=Dreissena polymorpha TaxID=45954 RepID=A0A9D4QL13_DREPO|nr:hypothetical protein DPMN_108481 [Dreissena polymorpha]